MFLKLEKFLLSPVDLVVGTVHDARLLLIKWEENECLVSAELFLEKSLLLANPNAMNIQIHRPKNL